MIYDVHKALYAFWSGFGVPAFVEGLVPLKLDAGGSPITNKDGDVVPIDPPYITFDVGSGDAFAESVLTAIDWHQARNTEGNNVQLERALLMDEIAKAIPPEGRRLRLDGGGFVVLTRNSAGFQSYYNPEDEPSVIGGRTSYLVRFYTE